MGHPFFADFERPSPGLYELLEDSTLTGVLSHLPDGRAALDKVDPADSSHVLSHYLAKRIQVHLESVPAASRVDEANRILSSLGQEAQEIPRIGPGPRQLLAVAPEGGDPPRKPATPLSDAALLTNTPHEPQIGREIAKELESADRVDLLIAFVK
jgi:hypothetical protein